MHPVFVCEHCQTPNPIYLGGEPWCHQCHHNATLPRAYCDCLMCFVYGPALLAESDSVLTPDLEAPPVPLEDPPSVIGESGAVQFDGRGFHTPTIDVKYTESSVTIRVDCAQNPEAWAEVKLSESAVEEFLRGMIRCVEYRALTEAAGEVHEDTE